MTNKGVIWKFIVERAPWQGGFWERMVRCVKRCLKKVVGRAFLSFEEMRTVLIEIEGTLNNRPLTYVYDEEQGISYPLTPSSLIYGRTIATTASDKHYDVISTNQTLTRRERYHRTLLKRFTNQWRSEYLTSLLETARATSGADKKIVDVGDLVILKSDQTSRAFWKVAKVEELIPSRDNVVKAAKIRVVSEKGGNPTRLRRPIQHLIPLELHSTSKDDTEKDHVQQADRAEEPTSNELQRRPKRKAAEKSDALRRNILKHC